MTGALEPVDLSALGLGSGVEGRSTAAGDEGPTVEAEGPSVELFLDPVCPFSYLAFGAMMPIVEDEGLRPRFHPLLLAGSDPAHSAAEARMHAQKAEAAWPGLQRLAASSFGIALEPVPWGARGATALAALLRVREQVPELEAAVWRAIFEARFMERADIDAPEIVAERLPAQAGIEAPDLDAEIEGEIDALRRSARDRAVTAVPTLIFSGGHAVVGAQPESVLRETLAQLRLAGAFLPSKNEDARSPLEGEGTPQD